jgi:pimeloyl-ACP methyl ester carboxylesterase
MAIYVLVHGAWSGGWRWRQIAGALRGEGHEVFVPTLTGLGERSHLLNASIDLSTHVKDVANVFIYENLKDVILVGASYGGMVITGASSVVADRIRSLVYVDAFLPENGQSLADLAGAGGYIAGQRETPGLVQPMAMPGLGVDRPDTPPRGPHPLLTLIEPVKLTGAEKAIPNHTYILATKTQPAPFQRYYDRVKDDRRWKTVTMDCGHLVMAEDPQGLLKVLREEAALQALG